MRKPIILVLVILAVLVGGGLIMLEASPPDPATQPNTPGNSQRSQSPSDAPIAGTINIKNNMFTPSQITVAKGGTVTWTNNDTTAHTVTIDQGDGPKSSEIPAGGVYRYTFNEAKSYQYHCSIHPSMRGTIVVK